MLADTDNCTIRKVVPSYWHGNHGWPDWPGLPAAADGSGSAVRFFPSSWKSRGPVEQSLRGRHDTTQYGVGLMSDHARHPNASLKAQRLAR